MSTKTASSKTAHRITGDHFYKFFQCPHWIWYDIYGDESKKVPMSPLLQMLYRDGLQHGREHLKGRTFVELKPESFKDLDEAFLATLELMRQGKNIYHGVLLDQHWAGMPDLLESRPVEKGMKSVFGDHYYVAYDIRNSESIRDDYKFQLVFYSLILERIQGVLPREAYIINAKGETQAFVIDDFLDYFHLTLERIERVLAGEKPVPFLKSGCRQSPWFSLCYEDAKACDDVSLIYRLSQNDQRRLYEAGIRTVRDLAAANLDDLTSRFEDWPFDKLVRFHEQANVLISGEPKILRKTELPEFETEIYFDVESDPTEDIDYLLGVLIKRGSKLEYKYFWADGKDDERKLWEAFLSLLESFDDMAIFHYSTYERQVFDRLANRYGISRDLDQKFKNSLIDVQKLVVDSVILPLYFYGLKDIAQYLGFSWHADDAGGAESVVWYNEWQKSRDSKLKKKILEYNEDDVRATLFVKDWLLTQKPRTVKESLE